MFERVRRHLPAVLFLVALAPLLTWPVARIGSTSVPGSGADDNIMFVWNFWWMRHALSVGLSHFLHTNFLFYPGGVDLVLHSHSALNAFIGATVFKSASDVAALNLTILLTCALNGLAMYALAYDVTARRMAAVLAALFFAASPCLTAHLYGHFNFYAAWGLPLFALTLRRALRSGSVSSAVLCGIAAAAVVYTDYYYAVYAFVLTLCVVAWRWLTITSARRLKPRAISAFDALLLIVSVLSALLAIWIARSGGTVVTLAGMRISLTTGTNVRTLASFCAVVFAWRRVRPTIRMSWARASVRGDVIVISIAGIAALIVIAPLVIDAVHQWRLGQYVSQTYAWRSTPPGVDVGTLLSGNPFGHAWVGWPQTIYSATGMQPFAGPAWLGLAPLALLWLTRRSWTVLKESSFWMLIAGVFFTWSLGSYLFVFGINTGLPLPGILLRYIPIVSNARIPSHAVILLYMAVGVLLSLAIASSRASKSTLTAAIVLALTMVDFGAAPIPTIPLDRPAVYDRLAMLPDGAVLELPFGFRDGFGETGQFDPKILFYQSIHEHPMLGGYVARLPPDAADAIRQSPLLSYLIATSTTGSGPAPDPAVVAASLNQLGVRYVVVSRRRVNSALIAFLSSWPMTLVDSDPSHELFQVR